MSNIVPSFVQSIFNEDVKQSIKDISEVGIDSVLEEGVLRDIPIIGTVTALCRTGINIKERNFIKQTVCFIREFNEQTISEEKYYKHKKMLEENSDYAEKELGIVIMFLVDNIEEELSKIAARIYAAYINKTIDWEDFSELIEANKRMFIHDYKVLLSINDVHGQTEKYRYGRLIGLGLIVEKESPAAERSPMEDLFPRNESKGRYIPEFLREDYQITSFGNKLLQFVKER